MFKFFFVYVHSKFEEHLINSPHLSLAILTVRVDHLGTCDGWLKICSTDTRSSLLGRLLSVFTPAWSTDSRIVQIYPPHQLETANLAPST